jgi:hypothetical protein
MSPAEERLSLSAPVERSIPLPFAFDTTIGYWTGEPDWALLERVLEALVGPPPGPASGWRAALRAARTGISLSSLPVTLILAEGALLVRGDAGEVQEIADQIQEGLRQD